MEAAPEVTLQMIIGHRLTGAVDEQLLARPKLLPHHHVGLAEPGAVQAARPAVLVSLWMPCLALLPQ